MKSRQSRGAEGQQSLVGWSTNYNNGRAFNRRSSLSDSIWKKQLLCWSEPTLVGSRDFEGEDGGRSQGG